MNKKQIKQFPNMAEMRERSDPSSDKYDADNVPSPMEILLAAYADSPEGARQFIESRVMEILMVDLPALNFVVHEGSVISVDEIGSIEEAFAMSMKFADEVIPEVGKSISMTLRDVARNIGVEIDRGFKRILLDDKNANRMSLLGATAAHAKLVKCIGQIALTEDEQKRFEDEKSS